MSNVTDPTASATYAVKEASGVTRERWDSLVTASPGGGHALQSFTWGEFKESKGWKPLRLTFHKGGEIVGTAQFLLYNTLPVPGRLMYCPKGPWIHWDDPEAVRAFFDGVRRIALDNNVHTVKIEPEASRHAREPKETLENIGFRHARYDLNFADTIVMDITPSDEGLMSGMTGKRGKTTRYNIRAAARNGVEIYRPQDFEWAFGTLWDWMQNLAENKEGFHLIRPREYIREVTRRMWEADQGRFFAAEHEGDTLAIAFFFDLGHKLWYMYSGSASHKQNLNSNYLLQWEAIRWARERGITYYDMVSVPPPGQRDDSHPAYGVYRFKKGFGGEILEFIGCMDLAVKPRLAAAWYNLEPFYYRGYAKIKGNIFY